MNRVAWVLLVGVAGCYDFDRLDRGYGSDLLVAQVADQGGVVDMSGWDAAATDLRDDDGDGAAPDLHGDARPDLASSDLAMPDLALRDLASRDLGGGFSA